MQREPSPVTGWRFITLAVAVWGAGGLVFFRQFLFSGFDRVFGDIGDGRLDVYLHEHLYQAVQGLAPFRSPAMFYPKSGLLGYSDAFLLDVPFYAPLRLLGCDPFLSYQLTWIALSLIGFVSFTALLVRFAGVRMSVALVGSALFAFPNMLTDTRPAIRNYLQCISPLWSRCCFSKL